MPYLAVKTLQTLAKLEKDNYPIEANITILNYYVDDLITGCETVNEAKQIYNDMSQLMKAGVFEFQKWSSNSQEFFNHVENQKLNSGNSVTIKGDSIRIAWYEY